MNAHELIIGSRGSDLALFQSGSIRDILANEHGCPATIKIIHTSGDRIDSPAFDKIEGKGFFTKELEDALLAREIDLAVHSLKDLMTTQPNGLKLGAVGYRVDRRELLIVRKNCFTGAGVLPVASGSAIGTSAARRKAQIAFHNPDLVIKDLRGNVPTRVRKLRERQYDAIVIAAAGVERLCLDLSDFDIVPLDPAVFLPAPAQGMLGIQIRDNDPDVESVIAKLNSLHAQQEAELERGLLSRFNAGCSLPLGVFSEVHKTSLTLKAVLGTRDHERWTGLKRVTVSGTDIDSVIDSAFDQLLKGAAVCA